MMASWSRRGGTAVVAACLILISHSSAWVSYSTRRSGLSRTITSSLFAQCGRGSACQNVKFVPDAKHRSAEADETVVPHGITNRNPTNVRRRLMALLPPIAVASFAPTGAAKCRPSKALLDARMQLDLAVQASQSWDDAEEIAKDPLLDEANLLRALELGSCQNVSRDRVTATVLEPVRKMRDILAKQGKTTEDAMTFMNYGTAARTAVDSYLE